MEPTLYIYWSRGPSRCDSACIGAAQSPGRASAKKLGHLDSNRVAWLPSSPTSQARNRLREGMRPLWAKPRKGGVSCVLFLATNPHMAVLHGKSCWFTLLCQRQGVHRKKESMLPLLVKLERLCWNTGACCQPPEEANSPTERPRPDWHLPGHQSAVATLGLLHGKATGSTDPRTLLLPTAGGPVTGCLNNTSPRHLLPGTHAHTQRTTKSQGD